MSAYHFSQFAIPPAVTAAVLVAFAVTLLVTRFSRMSLAVSGALVAAAAWQIACAFMCLSVDARTAPEPVYAACRRLKRDSYTGVVPSVVLSADDDDAFANAFAASSGRCAMPQARSFPAPRSR